MDPCRPGRGHPLRRETLLSASPPHATRRYSWRRPPQAIAALRCPRADDGSDPRSDADLGFEVWHERAMMIFSGSWPRPTRSRSKRGAMQSHLSTEPRSGLCRRRTACTSAHTRARRAAGIRRPLPTRTSRFGLAAGSWPLESRLNGVPAKFAQQAPAIERSTASGGQTIRRPCCDARCRRLRFDLRQSELPPAVASLLVWHQQGLGLTCAGPEQ